MTARRSRAREVALQLLFQRDQHPKGMPRDAVETFATDRLTHPDLVAFCLGLFDGTVDNQPAIDAKISATATNWRLHRMLAADRNVLRLGTYELLHDPAAQPVPVLIDEAIVLAKRYGAKDSPKFVNGILDAVARDRKSA